MIEFRAVNKHFSQHHVLKQLTLTVSRGEVAVVCGPSGSGKSTLIRALARLDEISSGDILVNGRSIFAKGEQPAIGFVFQQFNLYPHLTALENITLAPILLGKLSKQEARAEARYLLSQVGLADKAGHYPSELSGGQQQRVAIARALALKPEILLFDEPTSALDPETIGEVLSVIRALAHSGITMLVVTHEMGFAREVADRIIFLEQGEIIEQGTAERFFADPRHPRVRQFLRQILNPLHASEAAA